MSFDIFVQCFRNHEVATFKRAVLEEIFGPYVVDRRPSFMRAEFPDRGGGAEIYSDDEDDLDSVMFTHGGGDPLFDAIYRLVDRIKGVVYWADLPPCCAVTDAATLSHVPVDFIEGCGPAVVAKSGAEIIAAIQRG